MTEQRKGTWACREEVRPFSATPKELKPHPEGGNLPPCEAGSKTDKPCPRPATTHYGYVYYCGEHLAWIEAGQDYDEASLAVTHARRLLWRAQLEGIALLEHYLGVALGELEEERREADKALERAAKLAGVRDV